MPCSPAMQIDSQAAKQTVIAITAAILALSYLAWLLTHTLPTLAFTAIVILTYRFFLAKQGT